MLASGPWIFSPRMRCVPTEGRKAKRSEVHQGASFSAARRRTIHRRHSQCFGNSKVVQPTFFSETVSRLVLFSLLITSSQKVGTLRSHSDNHSASVAPRLTTDQPDSRRVLTSCTASSRRSASQGPIRRPAFRRAAADRARRRGLPCSLRGLTNCRASSSRT